MTRLYKCDRCKAVTQHVRQVKYTMIVYHSVVPFIEVKKDLCTLCFLQFASWINNELFVLSKNVYNPKTKTIKEVKQ